MRPLYDAVLFDLDGTLTDSEPGIVKSVQYALEKLRLPVPDRRNLRFFVGPPLMDSFLKAGVARPDLQSAVDFFQERYARIGWTENSVYPGIRELLDGLRDAGLRLSVATMKPERFAVPVLKRFDLYGYFERVCAKRSEGLNPSKADMIREALPDSDSRACMVGDRCYDMDGAGAAGIDGIGALWGCGSREELLAAGAKSLAETPDALQRLLIGPK